MSFNKWPQGCHASSVKLRQNIQSLRRIICTLKIDQLNTPGYKYLFEKDVGIHSTCGVRLPPYDKKVHQLSKWSSRNNTWDRGRILGEADSDEPVLVPGRKVSWDFY